MLKFNNVVTSHFYDFISICYFFYGWIAFVLFLNKVHMGSKPAHAWFVEITLIHTLVCVCVHPQGINNQ